MVGVTGPGARKNTKRSIKRPHTHVPKPVARLPVRIEHVTRHSGQSVGEHVIRDNRNCRTVSIYRRMLLHFPPRIGY